MIIDPLVFPCATGDENYIGGAVETIEAVRLINWRIPNVKTVLGVSNISFGLPAAAREVVNSVFLYYCTKAGLDLAIVNAEKLERFASIPERSATRRESAVQHAARGGAGRASADASRRGSGEEDWREQTREQKGGDQPVPHRAIAEHFRGAGQEGEEDDGATCRSIERLANYIIEGHQGRPCRGSGPQAGRRRRAARHHQRTADGGDVRSGPAVQQQRADRGRGAAIGRSDEGGGATWSSSWRRRYGGARARCCSRR
jgi:hypothetical protein